MSHILIIEDDRQNAHLLDLLITGMGHQCTCLHRGDEALEIARQLHPNLILLDMRLPGGFTGWQLARQFRQETSLRHIPILAVSVTVKPDDLKTALEAGCNEYLPKPFSLRILKERIEYYLGYAISA